MWISASEVFDSSLEAGWHKRKEIFERASARYATIPQPSRKLRRLPFIKIVGSRSSDVKAVKWCDWGKGEETLANEQMDRALWGSELFGWYAQIYAS